LVTNAVTTHARVLAPNEDEQQLTEEQLRAAYDDIVNEINNIAIPEQVVPAPAPEVIAEQLIANAAPAANEPPAPPAAGAGTGGGKKNRKSQKKPRKKVTRSKRGKKAARKTKKQSRRKSRGKKHGKKH
jgi:hypothetical protein